LVAKFDIGGVQRVNINMINAIDKEKFDVHVLYIQDGVLKQDITNQAIKLVQIGEVLKLKSFMNIKYIFKIIKYIKQNNISIIHTIDSILYMVGSTAAHFSKIKHIRSQPNFIRKYEKLNVRTLKILPFERWTNKYITFNKATKQDLHIAGVSLEKIHVLYNYPKTNSSEDEVSYDDIREKISVSKNTKIICSIGRLVEGKGLEVFLKMIPFIIEEYDNVIFLIVGDGPLKEKLTKISKELKIENYVYFLGFRTDISNIVQQITLGVYATAESAGMIDVPADYKVLISKQSEIMGEYVIDKKTGILVKSDEPKDYASSVLELLNDEELLNDMEANTAEYYKSNFDGYKNMRAFEDIVIDLVNN